MQFKVIHIFYLLALVACFLCGRISQIGKSNVKSHGWRPVDPVCECAIGPFEFEPETFFCVLTATVEERDFATAVALLVAAPVQELVALNPIQRCGIVGLQQQLELPGTAELFDEDRDVLLPGMEFGGSITYELFCVIFAEKYNLMALDLSEKQ